MSCNKHASLLINAAIGTLPATLNSRSEYVVPQVQLQRPNPATVLQLEYSTLT
jgi:hypothetical protein